MFSLVWIMLPMMRTQSAGQPVAESRGGEQLKEVAERGRNIGKKTERYVMALHSTDQWDGGSNIAKTIQKGSAYFWIKNGKDDNKRTKTGKVFATTVNPVRREEYEYVGPQVDTSTPTMHPDGFIAHASTVTARSMAKDCRGVPRNVNPVNARNPTVRHAMSVVVLTMSDQLVLD
ncbi:hypothetical protein Tco_0668553 [Tanacetum coccineum]